jgi:hypothetical protein
MTEMSGVATVSATTKSGLRRERIRGTTPDAAPERKAFLTEL